MGIGRFSICSLLPVRIVAWFFGSRLMCYLGFIPVLRLTDFGQKRIRQGSDVGIPGLILDVGNERE